MRRIGLIGVIGAGLALGCGIEEGGDDAFVEGDGGSSGAVDDDGDESSSDDPTSASGPSSSSSTTSTTEPNSDDDNGDTNQATDCDNLTAEGTEVGQVPPDFELVDANGEVHTLHEHCGTVVLIAGGPEW